jgi:repressor LexA
VEKLTKRQAQVLTLIQNYIEKTGFPPTRADIAAEFGFRSANAAEEHLRALARKGVIEIVPGTSRGIRLCKENRGIPIVGRVAAGSPILAEEHIEDYCELPNSFFRPRADYFLEVHGDSMVDAGILDRDLLAVHSTQQASNGQIIVARIGDEVTVKRFQRHKNGSNVRLMPANIDYDPIDVDLRDKDFAIEGLSVGILRRS